jgi:hypothetical protein
VCTITIGRRERADQWFARLVGNGTSRACHVVKDAGSDKGSDSDVADPGCKVRRSAIRGLSVPMVADDDAV